MLDHQTGLTLGSSVGELGTVMLKVQSRVPKDGGQCHVRLEVRDTRLGSDEFEAGSEAGTTANYLREWANYLREWAAHSSDSPAGVRNVGTRKRNRGVVIG